MISSGMIDDAPTAFMARTNNCNYLSGPWAFSTSQNSYSAAATIINSNDGFWVRAAGDCAITATGDSLRQNYERALSAGWNMVGGVAASTPFSSLRGDCTFARGPYWYNPSTNSYETPANMEPGKGYWIRVNGACTMKTAATAPPGTPV